MYITHDDNKAAIQTIEKHAPDINMMIAQAYVINPTGDIHGAIDPQLVQLSQTKSIKLLAMITNTRFDSQAIHQFLTNPLAEQNALRAIINECQKNRLAGVQFDFEMVPLSDKNNLTQFYQLAANLLHKNGFIVSFTIAPSITDHDFPSIYEKKLYDIWQGAYDLKALGAVSDFVTLMTYDQHGEDTIPGPIATTLWDKKVLNHVLQSIPANKLSLGIPTYSGLWYMTMNPGSKRITTRYDAVNFKTVQYILKKFNISLIWDNTNQINYAIYTPNVLNRYLFIENAASFNAKLHLASEYHLHSVSVFRLGIEDPAIWEHVHDQTKTSKSFWSLLNSFL